MEDLNIAVPLLSAFSMEPAGEQAEGVVGTANWHPAGGTDLSDVFLEAFVDEYDYTPGQAAMEAYEACLHYSAAVEQNGSFQPVEVAETLETFEWEYAMGEMAYRECDHQATRPVYVVEGVDEDTYQETDIWLDLLEEIPGEDVEYSCDEEPASNCDMPEREG
jgi:ABC-type branched-subunit amino acid transport system substrate-binding protein